MRKSTRMSFFQPKNILSKMINVFFDQTHAHYLCFLPNYFETELRAALISLLTSIRFYSIR